MDTSGTSVVHFIEVPLLRLLSDQLRVLRVCSDLLSE